MRYLLTADGKSVIDVHTGQVFDCGSLAEARTVQANLNWRDLTDVRRRRDEAKTKR